MGRDPLIATHLNKHITTSPGYQNILQYKTAKRTPPSPAPSKCFLPVVSGLLVRGGQIVRQTKKEAGHKPCHPCFSEAAGIGAGPKSSGKAPRFSRWE